MSNEQGKTWTKGWHQGPEAEPMPYLNTGERKFPLPEPLIDAIIQHQQIATYRRTDARGKSQRKKETGGSMMRGSIICFVRGHKWGPWQPDYRYIPRYNNQIRFCQRCREIEPTPEGKRSE